jgi:putative transposase
MKTPRQIFDIEGHAHFITFSCFHHLPLLSRDRCKQIVLGQLDFWSSKDGVGVVGYVIMPNHVHALLRPVSVGRLSAFMKHWKEKSSDQISGFLGLGTERDSTPFGKRCRDTNGVLHVWQARYYGFNIYTLEKAIEKLQYMHNNPVRAGLVQDACDWKWSTAAHFLKGARVPVKLVQIDGPLPAWLSASSRRE